MIFAIGDIHGCADELRLLLNRLPRTPETTIVCLGDYIDRGPSSREVIDTILELRQTSKVIALIGNHEQMLLDYLAAPESPAAGIFIFNGGSATLASYADGHGEVTIPEEHLDFLRSLRIVYETDDNVFVHAGLPQMPLAEIDPERDRETMIWTRGRFLTTDYDRGKGRRARSHPRPSGDVTTQPDQHRYRLCVSRPTDRDRTTWRNLLQRETNARAPADQLRDTIGIREAHRFTGTVPVRVRRGDRVHEFVTVDYSELGMYLRALDVTEHHRFNVGERIEGVVGPDDHLPSASSASSSANGSTIAGSITASSCSTPPPSPPALDAPSDCCSRSACDSIVARRELR